MHECPVCGLACDCDGEDTWFDSIECCEHDCGPDEDEDDWRPDEEDEKMTRMLMYGQLG
jgi:hypothetical protein